jgi:hypothetical protein
MKDLLVDKWVDIIDRPDLRVAVMSLTDGPSRCTNNRQLVQKTQICKGICVSPRGAQSKLTTQDIEMIKSYGFNPLGDYCIPGHVNNQENSSISYECRDGEFWKC